MVSQRGSPESEDAELAAIAVRTTSEQVRRS